MKFTRIFLALMIGSVTQFAFADGFGKPVPGNGGSNCGTNAHPCLDTDPHLPAIATLRFIECADQNFRLTMQGGRQTSIIQFQGRVISVPTRIAPDFADGHLNYLVSASDATIQVTLSRFTRDGAALNLALPNLGYSTQVICRIY